MYNYSLNCDVYFPTGKAIGKYKQKREKKETNKEE
jgi:hypothetical protein